MQFQFQNKSGDHRLAFASELHEVISVLTGYGSINGNLNAKKIQ